MEWLKKRHKAIISFSIYSHKRFQQPQNQDCDGQFPQEHLAAKGQLFVITNGINDRTESKEASEMVVNTITQVYYSDPSQDIVTSLRQAFKDANTLVYEIFNHNNGPNQKLGISCTALVLTKDRVYVAHIGNNQAYRISRHRIEKLTSNTLVGEIPNQANTTKKELRTHPKRSKLSIALGLEESIHIEINRTIRFKAGDSYLLCTYGMASIDDQKIKNTVLSNTPTQACKKLIYLAGELGCGDNFNVQVIRIQSATLKPLQAKAIGMKLISAHSMRWLGVALVLLLAVAALYKFRDKLPTQKVTLSNLLQLQNEGLSVKGSNTLELGEIENQNVTKMMTSASTFFQEGKLDSALTTYQAVLSSSPGHRAAIQGINLIAEAYENKARLFHQNANYEKALIFYRKAAQLQPNNLELENMILESEKKLQNAAPSPGLLVDDNKQGSTNSGTTRFIYKNPSSFESINLIETRPTTKWDFSHLSEEDYQVKKDKIIFRDSPNRKKALYRTEFGDFSIRAHMEVLNDNLKGRYGMIVGYQTMNESPYETFYLFSVFGQKQFLLQKYSNFKKEIVISIPAEADSINNLRSTDLMVKCQGPYMILYANQRRLRVCYGYENIKGRVGLYADPDLLVEFSEVEVTKATDSNNLMAR